MQFKDIFGQINLHVLQIVSAVWCWWVRSFVQISIHLYDFLWFGTDVFLFFFKLRELKYCTAVKLSWFSYTAPGRALREQIMSLKMQVSFHKEKYIYCWKHKYINYDGCRLYLTEAQQRKKKSDGILASVSLNVWSLALSYGDVKVNVSSMRQKAL